MFCVGVLDMIDDFSTYLNCRSECSICVISRVLLGIMNRYLFLVCDAVPFLTSPIF